MKHLDPLGPNQAEQLGATLATFRGRDPLVHCLTNIVVANFTANVLLAAGASPAMVDNAAEAEAFAAVAGGVLVNLGTPYADTAQAMAGAIRGAQGAGVPWVLDPVGMGVLPWRSALARAWLSQYRPAIVRGNASEIMALTGGQGSQGGRGVDSTVTSETALEAAVELARSHQTVVAVSGAVDLLTDGTRLLQLGNGHACLTRITGAGCALGALMAGFAAGASDMLIAAGTATALLTVAADNAAQHTTRPGSFPAALLDALDDVTPEKLSASVVIARKSA